MIELRNVTKIYKSKNRNDVTAIDDINLILPDKGMVFIIGKSGSGKSTLLNMIGGLDTSTKGEIICDGNILNKMKKYELTRYRSSYLSFIFQDYHVLDKLTVKQNIELALDLNNEKNEEKVNKIIQQVDLAEYVNRYPSELSGGQKQRIAVARALVKDSSMILCDEPTGNLDKKTTTQILDLLKKISQEKLVVIVSHSNIDANNYGDRIIELFDGKIFKDRQRSSDYSNDFKIENNVVYLPHYNDLTPNELIIVNEAIANNDDLKFKQIGNRFFETKIEEVEHHKVELTKTKINRSGSKKLYKLLSRKKLSYAFNICVISLLLVCFAIFQSFLNFNGNHELSKSLTDNNIQTVPLQKGVMNDTGNLALTTIQRVNDDDVDVFREAGYEGKIYYKYNNTLPINSIGIDNEGTLNVSTNFAFLYCRETLGTINDCNGDMFTNMYGKDGKIDYVAVCDEYKDYGIYITDYVADSIGYHLGKTYDEILGSYKYNKNQYGYINGIIDTDYKTKYKVLFDKISKENKPKNLTQFYNEIKSLDEYSDFLQEAINFLAYGYSFEEDYSVAIQNGEFRNIIKINRFSVSLDEKNPIHYSTPIVFYNDSSLNENEIVLSVTTFNAAFGTTHKDNSNFEPCEVTLTFYKDDNKNGEVEYQKTLKIIKLTSSTQNKMNLNFAGDLKKYDVVKYGIYLEDHQNISTMIDVATKNEFVINSVDATKLSTINRVLEIFGKFFLFIELFFLLVTIIFIINTGKAAIKKNKYEIGILKAIGTSNGSIIRQFFKQSIVLCLSIGILSNIGIYVGTMVGNNILVAAFEAILDTTFYDLRLINYIPELVFKDLIYIGVIAIISFIIPQIMLFRIRPIEIIRAKE